LQKTDAKATASPALAKPASANMTVQNTTKTLCLLGKSQKHIAAPTPNSALGRTRLTISAPSIGDGTTKHKTLGEFGNTTEITPTIAGEKTRYSDCDKTFATGRSVFSKAERKLVRSPETWGVNGSSFFPTSPASSPLA
jgi:hypothetical protein